MIQKTKIFDISENTKMTTLKEQAEAYVEPTTKNIVDLELVPIDIEINEVEYERKDPQPDEEKTFKVLEIEVNGEKYRVPKSVLGQLKKILEMKPETKQFSVGKTGDGMATKYTVVPM